MRYYIVGDIHGMANHLENIIYALDNSMLKDDLAIFCGDYIDRGSASYQVVEMLLSFSSRCNAVFLMGNHEIMLRDFLGGGSAEHTLYMINGGGSTIRSYAAQFGSFYLPENHKSILFSDKFYYETEDFIVVHAGFNPEKNDIAENSLQEMTWIREKFYRSEKKWEKTIIFGHTPTHYIGMPIGVPFKDPSKNIVGIDTGAVYGGCLTCLVMPGMKTIQSFQ
jgi:serine/threonine protein phosphatase 1